MGVLLTIGVHLLVVGYLYFNNMAVALPQTFSGIEIEFQESVPTPPPPVPPKVIIEQGATPRTPTPRLQDPVEVIQQATAPEVAEDTQRTQEGALDAEGDVERVEPPAEPVINQKALFRSRDKDTLLGEQTAQRSSTTPQPGHAQGNTTTGPLNGEPSAQLPGRTVVGQLPKPSYTENASGKVVVRILVDTYGKVTSATAGVSGTTVQNKTLWEAARSAALQARFNVSGSAPALQEGTITYIFSLR